MSSSSLLQPVSIDLSIVQYIIVLAVLIALLVGGLTALVRCEKHWLHDWLRLGWFGDLLLSSDPKQKTLVLRYLVGVVNCIAGIAALNFGVAQGVIDPQACRWLTICGLAISLGFYVLVRSGWSRHFSDIALIEAQLLSTVLFLAWGYAIGGPAKPVALLLLFVILMFSMFTSGTQLLIRASVLATAAFGIAMWHTAQADHSSGIEAQVQLVYFCVLLITLISLCLMVTELSRLRAKSTRRKQELSEALARIQELATRDDLTGLYNRRHMLELLNTEKHRSNRSGRPFCIGVIDVDHFKVVNDTHGHGVGDQALAAVASAISAGLRETDVVARWGGEEFLVMFTDTDCSTAEQVLARIQKSLTRSLVSTGVPDLRVTFSAGVTAYEADEMMTRTIDRADRALYLAKAAGRNRVVRATADQPLCRSA